MRALNTICFRTISLNTIFTTLALALLLTVPALAQRNFDKVQIKPIKVSGNIYMLEGSGGNIGVSIGEDGIILIDDQFAPLADKIRATLKELGGGELKFLLNTHWHGDHTGGNKIFGKTTTIISHENVRERLTTDQIMFGQTRPANPKEAWPVITFEKSLTIHFNGEEIEALHYPAGHTDGDIVIFFRGSNVVHMGDHFFQGQFPFIDLEHGGTVDGFVKNVGDVIEVLPVDVKVIPGHGKLTTLAELKQFHDMMVATITIVREGMAKGKELAKLQSEGFPEKWDSWGGGWINKDKWIETIYTSSAN